MARKNTSEMILIAQAGASLSIDASEKTTSDIINIARAIKDNRILVVRNANVKTTSKFASIAKSSSNILLEL